MTLILISFAIFAAYLLGALLHIRQVPPSLSETFYLIGDAPKCYLFTAALWAMMFTLLPVLLDMTPERWEWLAFLALTGIGFVGAAPFFHNATEGKVHTAAAVMAAVFGLVWCAVCLHWWTIIIVSTTTAVAIIVAIKTSSWKSSKTFWLEMVAFASVYLSAMIAFRLQ